jgi:hypothetical protein
MTIGLLLLLKVKQVVFLRTLDIRIMYFSCCHTHTHIKTNLAFVSITLQKGLFRASSHSSYSFFSMLRTTDTGETCPSIIRPQDKFESFNYVDCNYIKFLIKTSFFDLNKSCLLFCLGLWSCFAVFFLLLSIPVLTS